MLNRIQQAFDVLAGRVDIDDIFASLRLANNELSDLIKAHNEKKERNESLLKEIDFIEGENNYARKELDRYVGFVDFLLPENKSWARVASILLWSKYNKAEPLTDEELRLLMANYDRRNMPSVNALNQMISFLRTKKGINVKRKNSCYTL